MSRTEIEAAAVALRASRRSVRWDSAVSGTAPDDAARILVAACAVRLRTEPWYRETLVAELRGRIATASYHVPATTIVEQLIGRLTASALPD